MKISDFDFEQYNKNSLKKQESRDDSLKKTASSTTIEDVYVSNIELDENNVRYNKHDKQLELEQLAETIRLGFLIDPIDLEPIPDKHMKYKLLAGERRFRAVSEILCQKRIRAKVHRNLTALERTIIINFSNLGQRNEKTPEDMFKAYYGVLEDLKACDEETRKRALKLTNLSTKQMDYFKSIIKNTKQSDVEAFQKGELSFSSLKDIADYQKEQTRLKKIEDAAIKKYAETLENPSLRLYVNYDEHLLYQVAEINVRGKVMYGVKIKDYTTKLDFQWSYDSNLSFSESNTAMQIKLDTYAENNNLKECSFEDFVRLQKNTELEERKENSIEITKKAKDEEFQNEKFTEADYPEVNYNNLQALDDNINNKTNSDELEVEECDIPNDFYIENEDNHKDSNDESEKNIKEKETPNNDEQLDLIKNKYALNATYSAEEIESNKKVTGQLITIKTGDETSYYIIPDIKTTFVDEEVPQPESGLTVYGIVCYAYKVIPETVKILKE